MARALSLVIGADTMKDIDERQSVLLTIPPNAAQKGSGDKATATWMELFTVVESEVKTAEGNDDIMIFITKFRVPDDSPYPTNVGRTHQEWNRVNTAALAAGDKKSGQYVMSMISLGKLRELIRASGLPELEPGADIVPYYSAAEGEEPAIVGSRVYAKLKDKNGEDKDGNPVRRQEITRYIAENGGDA